MLEIGALGFARYIFFFRKIGGFYTVRSDVILTTRQLPRFASFLIFFFFLKQVLSIGNNVNIKISTRANSVQVIVDVNAFLNVWFKIAFAVESFTSEFLLNGRINVESVFELSDF